MGLSPDELMRIGRLVEAVVDLSDRGDFEFTVEHCREDQEDLHPFATYARCFNDRRRIYGREGSTLMQAVDAALAELGVEVEPTPDVNAELLAACEKAITAYSNPCSIVLKQEAANQLVAAVTKAKGESDG